MYLLERIDSWSERHHPKWIDLLRILLGVILLWKGVFFIRHTQDVVQLIKSVSFEYYSMSIAHYVISAYLAGGLLIAIGLLTRPVILFQLPAIIGSLVVAAYGVRTQNIAAEPELLIIVLFLLLFFLVEGSGRFSVDEYIRRHPEE